MKFKTAYGSRKRVTTSIPGKSLTHQSEAPACDINYIMKRYEKTRTLEHVNTFGGQYADFTNTPMDYQESMNAVIAADEMFSSLPAKVRKRFHNDAHAFLEFVANEENRDDMARLGLIEPPEAPSGPQKTSSGGNPPEDNKSSPSGGSEPPKAGQKPPE